MDLDTTRNLYIYPGIDEAAVKDRAQEYAPAVVHLHRPRERPCDDTCYLVRKDEPDP